MKRLSNYFVMFVALAGVFFLASCGEDTEVPSADPEISLGLNSDTAYHSPGDTLFLSNVSVSNYSTGDLEISQSTDGSQIAGSPFSLTENGQVSSTIQYILPGEVTSGTIELTFDLVDNNEMLASKTLVISIMHETVVDAAEGDESQSFSTFIEALEAAQLKTTLEGEGPFTVFAPTNAAFDAFLTANNMSKSELLNSPELADILNYHVLGVDLMSTDLSDGDRAQTLEGDSITVTIGQNDSIFINEAYVSNPDLEARNGIVHGVDKVLAQVDNFAGKLLYAPTGDDNSKTFFSSNNGMVYSKADVEGTSDPISKKIDFGYYYGVTDMASLASPADYPSNIYDLSSWSTPRNDTQFKTTNLSAGEFDAIKNFEDSKLASEYEEFGTAPSNPSRVKNLAEGDVVAFKTDDQKTKGSKYGLIKIVTIVPGQNSNDYIEIEVKVAK